MLTWGRKRQSHFLNLSPTFAEIWLTLVPSCRPGLSMAANCGSISTRSWEAFVVADRLLVLMVGAATEAGRPVQPRTT